MGLSFSRSSLWKKGYWVISVSSSFRIHHLLIFFILKIDNWTERTVRRLLMAFFRGKIFSLRSIQAKVARVKKVTKWPAWNVYLQIFKFWLTEIGGLPIILCRNYNILTGFSLTWVEWVLQHPIFSLLWVLAAYSLLARRHAVMGSLSSGLL